MREHSSRSVVQHRMSHAYLGLIFTFVAFSCAPGCDDRAGGQAPEKRASPAVATRTAHVGHEQGAQIATHVTEVDYPVRVYEPVFPGDHEYTGITWNELNQEPGESFEAYMYGYKRGTALTSIRIWPLEKPSRRMKRSIELLEEFLAIAYSSEVEVMDPMDPPAGAYNTHYGQYDANAVLNAMIRDERVDHVNQLNIAVTDEDAYAGRLIFVFGYADYVHHVGMLSLARLGKQKEQSTFNRRLLKLARHEVGHMYGMAHCTHPSCVMRGANLRAEADSIPLHMCPSCAAKLAWRIGDDGRARSDALAAFYREKFSPFLEKMLMGPVVRGD